MKEFLSHQGVPFTEKDVAADRQAAVEMVRRSGQQGVPVVAVDDQVVVGFDRPRLTQILDRLKPKLGASIADASSQAGSHPGIPTSGAYVGQVRPGSPVEKAGLRKGDVISGLAGQRVRTAGEVHELVRRLSKGQEVLLTYVRDGLERELLVRL